ncbi:hypothetical protein [Oryza sativa Japonica Group]|uniref:Uncharacterized protein P0702F03.12 n=1 Tax=Oryza sativa subsp. japonica TaxID=39947 RepID=Q9LGY3_ORYSJ|nr:hypothetical protein [Oryza sativa Japonica Group]
MVVEDSFVTVQFREDQERATAGKRPRVEERAGPHLVWVRGQKGERITGEVSGRGFVWI